MSLTRFLNRSCMLLALSAWIAPSPAHSRPVDRPHLSVDLVSESEAIQPGRPFHVGIHYKIEKDWHVYWKNPGDSGTPTNVKWKLPAGFSAGPVLYPFPERLPVPPLMNYGYEHEVILPIRIVPGPLSGLQEVTLEARIDWLVCKETCIPGKADLELSLPVVSAGKIFGDAEARLFKDSLERIPSKKRRLESAELRRFQQELELDYAFPPEEAWIAQARDLEFFPVTPGVLKNAEPARVEIIGNKVRALWALDDNAPGSMKTFEFALGSRSLKKAIESSLPVQVHAVAFEPIAAARSASHAPSSNSASLIAMILFGVLGGLILNVMPCVFPVLSIKVLGFVKKAGQSHAQVRTEGLLFSAGIILSFLALAGALWAFRSAGDQIGWGFQLQNPLFVGSLAFLFFLIGLNLLGLFEIGSRLMGLGSNARFKNTYVEAFASGVLATLVATPCTAPFMGAALGFALSQPLLECLAVFFSLGLGLALPYLLFAWFPGGSRVLPKPGAWMETLKQAFSFPIFATSIWLIWVFSLQTSEAATSFLLLGLLLCALGAWIQHRFQRSKIAGPAFLVLIALGWCLMADQARARKTAAPSGVQASQAQERRAHWETYAPGKILEAQKAGRPVFVDFTAAWCVSCQVNKKVALETSAVEQAFIARNTLLLRADWTNQNASIAETLRSFGRSGVPLYLLYPPQPGLDPKILPEVLTPGLLLDHLSALR